MGQTLKLCLLALCLSACSVVGMVSGVVSSAGKAALSAAGFEKSIDDAAILLAAHGMVLEFDDGLFLNVKIDALGGRLMLTGTVDNAHIKQDIVALMAELDGVREVVDFLYVGTARTSGQVWRDGVILTKMKSTLLLDDTVSAINFRIRVHRGVVYIFGIGEQEAQATRIVNYARDIKYVSDVKLTFETIEDLKRAFAFKVAQENVEQEKEIE